MQQGGTKKKTTGPIHNGRYKQVLCNQWVKTGSCPYTFKCQYAHGEEELELWSDRRRRREEAAAAALKKKDGKIVEREVVFFPKKIEVPTVKSSQKDEEWIETLIYNMIAFLNL